ncbi:Replication stress response regulator SDE2 [Frankliniella fusca]|uniref:Replication stress response regulator SDE2 n=1 Tax=Frankliniella fusca TaxID=407009 RepID=A0AAE1HDP7_9NEOP|nr:Replication stress response regulator SDE2 [Frankliniella fusca]
MVIGMDEKYCAIKIMLTIQRVPRLGHKVLLTGTRGLSKALAITSSRSRAKGCGVLLAGAEQYRAAAGRGLALAVVDKHGAPPLQQGDESAGAERVHLQRALQEQEREEDLLALQ